MKKLFLTSSFSDVAHYLEGFTGSKNKGKRVTFITTASIPEDYTGYVDDAKSAFEELGIAVDELDITGKTEIEISERFLQNDFIYVSGGNTFYLLQELKRSGADQLLTEQMDDKAKAIDLKDNTGLGVIPFYLFPHYKSDPFSDIVDEILSHYEGKLPLLKISNTQVLEIRGDYREIVGTSLENAD